MSGPQTAPYGFWKSPITSDLIVSSVVALGGVTLEGDATYWSEMRPSEGGRSVVVRRDAGGAHEDLTPAPFNARTRVHEYGGGSFAVSGGTVFFSNWADQRLYRLDSGQAPRPITPETAMRYADAVVDAPRGRLICVREDHTIPGREATNVLASVDLEGVAEQQVLVSGADFYSSPRLSPDGARLAWLSWHHPNMPWDGCDLRVSEVRTDGSLGPPILVAGGPRESVFQPEWSHDGRLYFVSDRTGWWNLYRLGDSGVEPLAPMEAEFGDAQWLFGLSLYAFESPERIVCAYTQDGAWRLALLNVTTRDFRPLDLPFTAIEDVRASPGQAVFWAASPTEPAAIVRLDLDTLEREVLRSSTTVDDAVRPYFSLPVAVDFPAADGAVAHAIYYPPHNPDFQAADGERPPLLVKSHGGPTGASNILLALTTQYWTSRGIAVLDVNYGGSTGYGRAYRERLEGRWGIVDVDDCVSGARWLAARGEVDGGRMAISGGSAGGYTTLCALTFRDAFQGGASHFGVSDLEALARDTHKFESRYLDRLIGPYPERRDLYLERSPIYSADRLAVPVAFFQGAEDAVVPPSQTEQMVDALRAKGIPVSYFLFDGEQHGFRKADNIKRALDAELYFYAAQVFNVPLRF